jgi:hypothetical protein
MYETKMLFNDELVLSNLDKLLAVKVERRYTSKESVDAIISILNLNAVKDSFPKLQAIRNSVVKCISDKEDAEGKDYLYHIMSITAVIDNYMVEAERRVSSVYTIDIKSDPSYYIVYKDNKKFVKVNKNNPLSEILEFYGASIKEEEVA